jgi:hypothetical protein
MAPFYSLAMAHESNASQFGVYALTVVSYNSMFYLSSIFVLTFQHFMFLFYNPLTSLKKSIACNGMVVTFVTLLSFVIHFQVAINSQVFATKELSHIAS